MPSSCSSTSQISRRSCITVSNVVGLISQSTTYLQTLHHLPVSVSYLLFPTLNFTVTLSDIIIRRSRVKSFFTDFSWSSSPHWCLLRLLFYDCVSPCHVTGDLYLPHCQVCHQPLRHLSLAWWCHLHFQPPPRIPP